MITRLELELKTDKKVNNVYGNLLQGYLMSLLNSDYADFLHETPLNPYSQYVYYDKEKDSYIWRIATLNEEAKKQIIDKVLAVKDKTIELKHNDITLKIISNKITEETSYKNIADKYFLSKTNRVIKIRTLTSATYKSNGQYQMFPEVKSLYVSLFNKWNEFNTKVDLNDGETLQHLINHTHIDSYDLKSTKFATDGINIKSFKGTFSLYVKGPSPLVNIANMLFDYGQYSGLGAKTSMGMGGIILE